MNFEFLRPVFAGDTIVFEVTIEKLESRQIERTGRPRQLPFCTRPNGETSDEKKNLVVILETKKGLQAGGLKSRYLEPLVFQVFLFKLQQFCLHF